MFYLDLHSHSVASDDSRATVEQYIKWIRSLRNRGMQVDGIVLTEHRQFNPSTDYSSLASEYNVVVLRGAELDTRHGHFLVYGVTEELTRAIDFSDVHIDPFRLMELADQTGQYELRHEPLLDRAHAGQPRVERAGLRARLRLSGRIGPTQSLPTPCA